MARKWVPTKTMAMRGGGMGDRRRMIRRRRQMRFGKTGRGYWGRWAPAGWTPDGWMRR